MLAGAGLKNTAFEYASMLMRPEYRKNISENYKRKIENIVRKPEKCDEEDPMTPCPFCKAPGSETNLECSSCKNVVPYCVATGSLPSFPVLGTYNVMRRPLEANA